MGNAEITQSTQQTTAKMQPMPEKDKPDVVKIR
jgi:hypothetical protein